MRKIAATEIYTGSVSYSDASPKTLFTLPANTIVVDAFVNVTTTFDDASATLDIGDDSDADGIIPNSNIDLSASGFQALAEDDKGAYLWDGTNKQMYVYTSSTDIKATISAGTSTQGEVKIYIVVMDIRYL